MSKSSVFLNDLLAEMVLPEVQHHPCAPKMPPNDHTNSTIPCLPFTPRSQRMLETIHPISHEDFQMGLTRYLDELPQLCLTSRDQRRFNLPEPGLMAWPPNMQMDDHFRKFSDDILGCVYSILHFIDRSTELHGFGLEKSATMHCGWSNNNWGTCNPIQHRLTDVKVVTVTMPAWCFAPKDMADFVNMRNFVNPADLSRDMSNVPTAVKLWARLHDFCYLHDAHYFIVSTYEQWTFGAFSDLYSTGFVAPPMRFDATTPNVFQAAMFWMHSAHGHKNGYKPTPVYSEMLKQSNAAHDASASRKGKRKDMDEGDAGDNVRGKPVRRIFSQVPWLANTAFRPSNRADEQVSYTSDYMHFTALNSSSAVPQNDGPFCAAFPANIPPMGGPDFSFATFPDQMMADATSVHRQVAGAPARPRNWAGRGSLPPQPGPSNTQHTDGAVFPATNALGFEPAATPVNSPSATPRPSAADTSAPMEFVFTPVTEFQEFDTSAGLCLGDRALPPFSTSMIFADANATAEPATMDPSQLLHNYQDPLGGWMPGQSATDSFSSDSNLSSHMFGGMDTSIAA